MQRHYDSLHPYIAGAAAIEDVGAATYTHAAPCQPMFVIF